MIRRFNYTGRKKLPVTCAYIELFVIPEQPSEFRAEIDLSGHQLPSHAGVYVEAYYRSSLMRFSFGTVATCSEFAEDRFVLSNIQNTLAFFRVKVVDESGEVGRILATIDRIKPTLPQQSSAMQSSIFSVQFTDLGDQVWQVDVDSEHGQPVLQVNETLQIADLQSIVLGDMFVSLVFPAAIQQVLSYMLFQAEPPEEGEVSWISDWIRFAAALQQCPASFDIFDADPADKQQYIEDTVRAFSAQHRLKSRFEQLCATE